MILGKKKIKTKIECVEYCEVCGQNLNNIYLVAKIWCEASEANNSDSDGDYWATEICPLCFVNRVIPALEAAGIKVRKRKYDSPDSYVDDSKSFPLKLNH